MRERGGHGVDGGQRTSCKSPFSTSHHEGSGDRDGTEPVRHGSKCLYPPSQLTSLPFSPPLQTWVPYLRNAVTHSEQVFPHQLTGTSTLLT